MYCFCYQFQYLEKRFDSKLVRTCCSMIEVLEMILYGGVALFAPAVALATGNYQIN